MDLTDPFRFGFAARFQNALTRATPRSPEHDDSVNALKIPSLRQRPPELPHGRFDLGRNADD